MPPPRFAEELLVNVEVWTVVGRLSLMMPPPEPVAWLFEKVDVPNDALPEPVPPGDANAKMYRSAPPPPTPAAVLPVTVDPVTVRMPVPPVCIGDDGV